MKGAPITAPALSITDNISDRSTDEIRAAIKGAETRAQVAAILGDMFPGLYVHTGGHHVAVCIPGRSRVVMVSGTEGDWA